MTERRLEFFYDFSCPYAYLAHTQVETIAARAGAELVWKPMLLGGVFQAIGAPQLPSMPAAKGRHNTLDMLRWANHWGVPLTINPAHPARTLLALRATLASGDIPRATKALFRAYWVESADVSRPEVVAAALDRAGFDGAALVARAEDAVVKAELRTRTEEAVARGAFGAPTLVVTAPGVAGEVFWGQDRLGFVERALGGWSPGVPSHDGAALPSQPRAEMAEPKRPSRAPAITHGTGFPRLDFFFDFSSPFSYLASTQIEELAIRSNARLVYRPFLLGALFKKIGTPDVPLFAMPEAKRRHAMNDLARWADVFGVPLRFSSHFPINTVKPLRMVLAASELVRPALIARFFRAIWVEDRDLASDAALVAIADEAGSTAPMATSGAALLDAAKSESMRSALRSATDDAEAAGVFGAPCFAVDGMLFWGQDRLEFVEKALGGWRPVCG